MAVNEDRHAGEHEVVYVASTLPTDPTDPTDAAYEPLGLRTTRSLQSQAPETEIGDVHGTTKTFGTNAGTFNVGWNTAPSVDAGQEIVRTGHFSNPKPLRYFLITSGAVGDRLIHFKGYVGQFNDTGDYNSPMTSSAVVGLDGNPTYAVVAA